MDGWTDGRTDDRMDGWMDGGTSGWMRKQCSPVLSAGFSSRQNILLLSETKGDADSFCPRKSNWMRTLPQSRTQALSYTPALSRSYTVL